MLRYLYADQLYKHPKLARAMFLDRADQFRTRLGWDVAVDADGGERDEYDEMNPLYVIWEEPGGGHGGSMRFLPTTGSVMINDHFGDLIDGPVCSPLIWECTRFCLKRGAGGHVAAALMLGGGEIMQGYGIKHFVGVFDARMIRIYRMIGSSPEVLGSQGTGKDQISVGLWDFTLEAQAQIAERAGITLEQSRFWFDQGLGNIRNQPWVKTA
ncbi:Autoinducer synthesis protein [Sulfitobacter noctilucicola]|uniref:Acyl-homoserine-lactone synthase n=1 Tax=Sulfitobacter noctilucicola TaxID=1342301 RepID=A0A7W6Q6G7_9RHOB|nr:acyl-homoserine-lactone synthase [Sulfitobacter noctilucicola]KIN63699.1 Autoinducer synthesis protein [Sulfitobacter noctilucicola]MBB4174790.1 acyl homoserine lactone synthase [Sulfitobacter noctilucicola]